MDHDHGSGHSSVAHDPIQGVEAWGWALFDALVILALVTAAVGYAACLWAARGRSPWPVRRTVAWYAGLACAGGGLIGPVAAAAHTSFATHMLGHLLLGMLTPLLLVLAAPLTLALRALPVTRARSLTGLLRSQYVRVVTHPVVAAVLNAGGLWVLYSTELYQLLHTSVLVYGLVHAHIFVAGYLFTAALVGPDPDPHRASVPVRSAVLICFIAAHSILAKWLYAHPPVGVEVMDGQVGAQLMYYGGDAVDVVLIVLLFAGWYSTTRPKAAADAPPGAQSTRDLQVDREP